MDKKVFRELALLSLPLVGIIGVALWTGSGRQLWRGSFGPHVDMAALRFRREGPLSGQNKWDDADFLVTLPTKVNDPFKSLRRTQLTAALGAVSLVDQWGNPLPTPVVRYGFIMPYLPNGIYAPVPSTFAPGAPNPAPVPGPTTTTLAFDLDRVPVAAGEVTMRGSWTFSDGSSQPFSLVARPAWFCRAPKTLQVVSARFLPPDAHSDGGARIVVRSTGTARLNLDLPDATYGSAVDWTADALAAGEHPTHEAARAKLLYNWSPHFTSLDGAYDSHAARDAYVWAKVNAPPKKSAKRGGGFVMSPISIDQWLTEFNPRITTFPPLRQGSDIQLTYRFHGLGTEPRAQVFVAVIGVPRDGFLSVKVPLPARNFGPQMNADK